METTSEDGELGLSKKKHVLSFGLVTFVHLEVETISLLGSWRLRLEIDGMRYELGINGP